MKTFNEAITQRSETACRETRGDEGSSPSGFTSFNELEQQHRPLLFKLCNKWTRCNTGLDEADLLQVGRLALWRCWQIYDEARGVSFVHFCMPYVKAAMRDHVWRTEHVVRVPWERWRQRQRPSIDHMDADEDTLRLVERQACELPVSECGALKQRVHEVLTGLKPKARDIVMMHFFEGLSARKIAQRNGVTHQAVSDMLRRTLAALRGNRHLNALQEGMA